MHSFWRCFPAPQLLQRIQDTPGYTTHVITEKGIDFIKRNKDQPFFLYLPHAAVHNPYQSPADTPETRDKDWKRHRSTGAEKGARTVGLRHPLPSPARLHQI